MKAIYSIILIGISCISFSQSSQLATADRKYNKYSYVDAIEIYEKVAEKGYQSPELFKKLGNAYYFNGELDKAAKWYKDLFAMNEDVDPEYYFRYSQALKAIEDYDNANKYLSLFNEKTNDSRGNEFAKNKDYLKNIEAISGKYTIGKTSINSEFSDYGPSYLGNQLVFASARKEGALFNKIHDWTKQNFTDLYSVTINSDKSLSEPQNFSKSINSKFNESSPVFTKDGKTMYFTRNNYLDGKKGKDDNKSTLVKIYKASFIDNEWKNITELPFNNDNYSTAHPTLSTDNKTMYFASDIPGGFGNSDIYKVKINDDGTFGTPENLGNTINTEGRETFPNIAFDNTLYFASDGHLGLGGLDVFESKFSNNQFQKPENVGKPINSSMDDFGFIVNKDKSGFFTSNRDGGSGYDDIYSFTICAQKLYGIVTDVDTKEILPNSKVILFDSDMKKITEMTTDETGKYTFEIECSTKYHVRASKEEYETTEKTFTSKNETGETELNLELKRNIFPIKEGTDLAKIFDISIIYFDLDKWNIRPDAAKDLQKILEVMKKHPKMEVDIRSHTDSRQTHRYNEILSDRRAKSTLEYLVKNGIEKSRLTAKGYGETQLVNNCSDGVKCSEAEHQKNRRSEFIVTKME
ncbi:OmpA family protein [Flavobacterium sediminilitoris]|uniref:OmpA family protein n=1 Tax=Flavobacterium sediminilitoris TaxID=2024526 RepID=A0ABY4HKC6_9FLAO|nr:MULTISPECIES: OmpA family protein [Flavobacterium]UOX33160.1 OmpA family protein [Flavobacterium sediminilitoris]